MKKLTEEERKKRNSERCKRWLEEKRLHGTLDSYNKERYAKNKDNIKKKCVGLPLTSNLSWFTYFKLLFLSFSCIINLPSLQHLNS